MPSRNYRKGRRLNTVHLLAAFLTLLAARAAPAQCYYTWTQIPVPPGWLGVFPLAINSNGHVVGHLYNQGDNIRSFLWTPETGTTVLPMPPGVFDLQANDMNDDEVIVGTMFGGANRVRAFVRRDGEYSFIEYPDWANTCVPYSISNRGQVAGMVQNNGPGPTHAFFWEAGVFHDLGPLIGGPYSVAKGINNRGVITGLAQRGDNPNDGGHAFLTDGESVNWLPEPEDFPVSWGQKLNDNGITVGRVVTGTDVSDPNWRYVGGIWQYGRVEVIEAPPTNGPCVELWAVNNAGRVVGSYTPDRMQAFVWQNGAARPIDSLVQPPLSRPLRLATAINELGQIVASSNNESFVLSPVWLTGDLTGDCHVAFDDLLIVLANFGSPPEVYLRGDVDGDGDVDLSDLVLLLSHWHG